MYVASQQNRPEDNKLCHYPLTVMNSIIILGISGGFWREFPGSPPQASLLPVAIYVYLSHPKTPLV